LDVRQLQGRFIAAFTRDKAQIEITCLLSPVPNEGNLFGIG
jgi:hypothetical protein